MIRGLRFPFPRRHILIISGIFFIRRRFHSTYRYLAARRAERLLPTYSIEACCRWLSTTSPSNLNANFFDEFVGIPWILAAMSARSRKARQQNSTSSRCISLINLAAANMVENRGIESKEIHCLAASINVIFF